MHSPSLSFEMFADVPERAIAFYTSLFSWSFERAGTSSESWSISLTAGSGGSTGRLLKRQEILVGNVKFQSYINGCVLRLHVTNIETTLGQAARLGGIVRSGRTGTPGFEQLAYLMDTEGNMVCVVQPQLLS